MKYLLLLLLFASCTTAEKLTHRAIAKDAGKVQEITRNLWPCIVTAKDSILVTDTLYDLVEVQCPDSIAYRIDSFETNTAVRVPYRVPVYVKVPMPRIRETKTVTIRIKDMIDSKQIAALTKKVAELKGRSRVAWAIAAISLILFLLALLIKRR